MALLEHHHTDLASDPEPVTPSDDSIRIAESLREAIRRKLLNRPEPPVNPYWAVGAD